MDKSVSFSRSFIICCEKIFIGLLISLLPNMIHNLTISFPLHTTPVHTATSLEELLENLKTILLKRNLFFLSLTFSNTPARTTITSIPATNNKRMLIRENPSSLVLSMRTEPLTWKTIKTDDWPRKVDKGTRGLHRFLWEIWTTEYLKRDIEAYKSR